jgi:hypothetical protein
LLIMMVTVSATQVISVADVLHADAETLSLSRLGSHNLVKQSTARVGL